MLILYSHLKSRLRIQTYDYTVILNSFTIMKSSLALNVVLGFPFFGSAFICGNNCGRAVAGTARQNPPLATRRSQCETLVTTTVTITLGLVRLS